MKTIMLRSLFCLLFIPVADASFCQKENVEFDIHYHWFISPNDSCKNIRLEIMNWSKNDESNRFIFNGRDTFEKEPDYYLMNETGEHSVKIISSDKNGKEYTYEKKLIVECDTNALFRITSYSGCGSHHEFSFITDSTVSLTKLVVFDRWGELLFESKENPIRWKGQINAGNNRNAETICPAGSYPFVLFFKDKHENDRYYISHFNLVR